MAEYTSLDELINYYNSNKPTTDGSSKGFLEGKTYWSDYANAISEYASKYGSSDDFDYTKYKLYNDYVNNEAKSASDVYSNYLLREKSALDSKATLANIKESTMKYAGNTLEASGLGKQGVAQSVLGGIGNNYASGVQAVDSKKNQENADAYNAYQQSLRDNASDLATNEYAYVQENRDNVFNTVSTLMESGVDYETLMEKYGDQLTDDQKQVLELSSGNAFVNQAISYGNGQGMSTWDELSQIKFGTDNRRDGSYVSHEIQYLLGGYGSRDDGFLDSLTNGLVVQLGNGNSGEDYSDHLFLVYKDGKWYQTTSEAFSKATNKKTIIGK